MKLKSAASAQISIHGRSFDEAETRGRDVARLLHQGLDHKLLRGGTEEAMRLLREAREASLRPDPLPWPWPQLTAYRLAYLMMSVNRLAMLGLTQSR